MNIRELRPCKKCGKMISGLEEFPGQICLNCHKQKFEKGGRNIAYTFRNEAVVRSKIVF